jgi:uncharacterized protein with PIN domain
MSDPAVPGAADDPEATEMLRCDTCGRPAATVARVVVEAGYNRANARPIYNCPECYEKKNRERLANQKPPDR